MLRICDLDNVNPCKDLFNPFVYPCTIDVAVRQRVFDVTMVCINCVEQGL